MKGPIHVHIYTVCQCTFVKLMIEMGVIYAAHLIAIMTTNFVMLLKHCQSVLHKDGLINLHSIDLLFHVMCHKV